MLTKRGKSGSILRAINQCISFFAGEANIFSLENRLFNSLAILNGLANVLGSINYTEGLIQPQERQTDLYLFILHFISGLSMLIMYLIARLKKSYSVLFWPFISIIFLFLFVNVLYNAGSQGGAHYYLISAVLIAVILSPNNISTIFCFILGTLIAYSLFWIEWQRPEWIKFFEKPEQRFEDVPGAFIFMQILNGVLVLVLRKHFNEERDKSERLLLNILPKRIAEELKVSERVQPVDYHEASVLFTDFVGFTRFAEKLQPQELLEKLDDVFRSFDSIVSKYDLEKIKTIGDSYMAVGGVPEVNSTHFLDASLAALEMQQYMLEVFSSYKNEECWELRIGIHTGHLIAGVIGEQKFAYDVWGDAVNIASRMESSSLPGKINISAEVYDRIKKFFDCTHRGKIETKNKGTIEMYFIEGLRSVYSMNREGTAPNKDFWKAYNQVKKRAPLLSAR